MQCILEIRMLKKNLQKMKMKEQERFWKERDRFWKRKKERVSKLQRGKERIFHSGFKNCDCRERRRERESWGFFFIGLGGSRKKKRLP